MSGERAADLVERGNRLKESGFHEDAERVYREAASLSPEWSVPHFNLGLLYKGARRWRESLDANRRVTNLDPADRDAWWNLGIAATALREWETARVAWAQCGIELPPGDGPPDGDFGLVPIRLVGASPEVVWCDRIDPARARIVNIPLPESGHGWGDVVLHDGVPNGTRTYRGRDVPVFDEIERMEASPFATFELELDAADEALDALEELAESRGGSAEDWSRSVCYLCKQCSEGKPPHLHDEDLRGSRAPIGYAIAARDEAHLESILEEWTGQGSVDVRAKRRVYPYGTARPIT